MFSFLVSCLSVSVLLRSLSRVGFNVDASLINPHPLNMDYNRDPNSKALTRRAFMNQGSTLVSSKAIGPTWGALNPKP